MILRYEVIKTGLNKYRSLKEIKDLWNYMWGLKKLNEQSSDMEDEDYELALKNMEQHILNLHFEDNDKTLNKNIVLVAIQYNNPDIVIKIIEDLNICVNDEDQNEDSVCELVGSIK